MVGLIFVLAQLLPLDITEIMYDLPGKDDGYEWIEVKNISNQVFNLKGGKNGWRIYDGSNHLFKDNLIINPQEIFVIVQDKESFYQKYPNFNGKLIEANFSLKNTSSTIKILDENGTLLAERNYQKQDGGNGNGKSLVFKEGLVFESEKEGGSPGYEDFDGVKVEKQIEVTTSSIQQQIQTQLETSDNKVSTTSSSEKPPDKKLTQVYYSKLYINEIMPDPTEEKDSEGEFIELYNNGQEDVDLSNLILEIDGKSLALEGTIKANEYFVISRKEKNFILKNDGSSVILKDKQGNVIHKINYYFSKPGLSLSRFEDGSWKYGLPTPNKQNIQFLNNKSFSTQTESSFKIDPDYVNKLLHNTKFSTSSLEWFSFKKKLEIISAIFFVFFITVFVISRIV